MDWQISIIKEVVKVPKTNLGLVEYCKAQLGLPYWWGTFGHVATEGLLRQKSAQYPKYYTANDFNKQYGKRVHDCVGLIKGYLWCDTPTSTPKYNANQDKNVSGMLEKCSLTGNINTMPDMVGTLVFMDGHVGVYIGNGKVIEARGHAYGVVETNLIGRGWTKWGQLDWIDYADEKVIELFKDGDELKAIDYLVETGRILDKEQALKKLEIIKNENWTYIKWANDVKTLLN